MEEKNIISRCSNNVEMTGLRRMGEKEEENYCIEWAYRPPYQWCLESDDLVCGSVGCRHIYYHQGKHLMLVLLYQNGGWRIAWVWEANVVVLVCRQWLLSKEKDDFSELYQEAIRTKSNLPET